MRSRSATGSAFSAYQYLCKDVVQGSGEIGSCLRWDLLPIEESATAFLAAVCAVGLCVN